MQIEKKKIIKFLKNKFAPISKADEIYLFGSYAKNKTHENSDVDICIVKNNIKNYTEELIYYKYVKKHLDKILIAKDVLIVNKTILNKYKDTPGTIQYEIMKKGEKIF